MRSRHALLGLLVIAVGCGSLDAPAEKNDTPSAQAPAPADDTTPSSETAASQAATEPAPAAGSGAAGATPRPPCKVGFQKDVLPKLVASCAQSSCHGAQSNRPFIEAESAQTTHDELMEFEFGSLEWSDPHSAYSGATEPELKKAIDAWRMCGAPL